MELTTRSIAPIPYLANGQVESAVFPPLLVEKAAEDKEEKGARGGGGDDDREGESVTWWQNGVHKFFPTEILNALVLH